MKKLFSPVLSALLLSAGLTGAAVEVDFTRQDALTKDLQLQM